MWKLIATTILMLGLAAPVAAEPVEMTPVQAKALEIYRTIISMRTAKGHGNVPGMIDYLAGEFKTAGFSDDDIKVYPVGETAAMTVTLHGDGSSGAAPYLFLGHMDVVDALPEDWELDPFTLTEQDGYFFGRGTADNKFGIMNLTQTFIRLKQEGFVPTRDLIIAFSGDEETGMLTTRVLAKELAGAEFALNSDAGGGALSTDGRALTFGVQAAEKTYATYELTATNPGGHSSRPRPDNAIYDLVAALDEVEEYKFPVMSNSISLGYFAAMGPQVGGDLGKAMSKFAANPKNKKAARGIAKSPSFVGMTRTTCVATMLRAGHAENALPQSATATVNCRIFPGVAVDAVKATLTEIIDNDSISIAIMDEPIESPVTEMRDDITAALTKAVHARYPGTPVGAYMESGGTDGMHFRSVGVPTLAMSGVFMNEDDMYAHGLNERVPTAAFYDGLEHWMIIIKELAAPAAAE